MMCVHLLNAFVTQNRKSWNKSRMPCDRTTTVIYTAQEKVYLLVSYLKGTSISTHGESYTVCRCVNVNGTMNGPSFIRKTIAFGGSGMAPLPFLSLLGREMSVRGVMHVEYDEIFFSIVSVTSVNVDIFID